LLKSVRFWIGLGISVLFLLLFFYRTDFSEMGRALKGANYIFLLPAIVVYFVGVWFRAWRWHYLLRPLGKVATHRLFSLVVIGFTVNDILPGRLGIFAQSYILGEKEGMSKTAVFATVAVERIFDGLALLLYLIAISLFVPLADLLRDLAGPVGIPWAVLVLALAALFIIPFAALLFIASYEDFVQRLANFFLNFLPIRWASRLKELVALFLTGLRGLRSPWVLLAVFLTSMLVWLCEAGMFYLLAFAFDLGQPFYVLLLATSTANLAIALPSSQGGIGLFEFFCQRTLIFFGVQEALATAYVIALHAALLLPVIVIGFGFLWLENLSLAEVVRQRGREDVDAHPDSSEEGKD